MIKTNFFKGIVTLGCLITIGLGHALAQQVSDENFTFPISTPAYQRGNGPLLLFDEGHHNASTLKGVYAAFAKLLEADGYNIISSKENINLNLLKKAKIFITINAMYDLENWNLPARAAFSQQEIDQLVTWVAEGGSLFLVTDHMPCGASVHTLAEKFGINVINGFALRNDGKPELFSRRKKTLLPNEITNRHGKEIDSIMCWGGTGFIVPPTANIISILGKDYTIYLPQKVTQIKRPIPTTIPTISGVGIVNGAYQKFGKGRVVIFGDGAPFSAQLHGVKSEKRGMNHPDAKQNAQFLLNIIHWLDGK